MTAYQRSPFFATYPFVTVLLPGCRRSEPGRRIGRRTQQPETEADQSLRRLRWLRLGWTHGEQSPVDRDRLMSTHNPKVAGSNPASATKRTLGTPTYPKGFLASAVVLAAHVKPVSNGRSRNKPNRRRWTRARQSPMNPARWSPYHRCGRPLGRSRRRQCICSV